MNREDLTYLLAAGILALAFYICTVTCHFVSAQWTVDLYSIAD